MRFVALLVWCMFSTSLYAAAWKLDTIYYHESGLMLDGAYRLIDRSDKMVKKAATFPDRQIKAANKSNKQFVVLDYTTLVDKLGHPYLCIHAKNNQGLSYELCFHNAPKHKIEWHRLSMKDAAVSAADRKMLDDIDLGDWVAYVELKQKKSGHDDVVIARASYGYPYEESGKNHVVELDLWVTKASGGKYDLKLTPVQ